MQFKKGTSVYSSDGHEIGRIDRIVLNPSTKQVTHLVVRQGLLLTEDKIVPIEIIESSTAERVILRRMADALDLPAFEETHYIEGVNVDKDDTARAFQGDYVSPLLWYPPVGTAWWTYPSYYPSLGTEVIKQNIPNDTVALQEGARVISADDDHVGNIERIFVDENTKRATHFLISQGLIFKDRKLVPTAWVTKTGENEVRLTLTTRALDNLPTYEEDREHMYR